MGNGNIMCVIQDFLMEFLEDLLGDKDSLLDLDQEMVVVRKQSMT